MDNVNDDDNDDDEDDDKDTTNTGKSRMSCLFSLKVVQTGILVF